MLSHFPFSFLSFLSTDGSLAGTRYFMLFLVPLFRCFYPSNIWVDLCSPHSDSSFFAWKIYWISVNFSPVHCINLPQDFTNFIRIYGGRVTFILFLAFPKYTSCLLLMKYFLRTNNFSVSRMLRPRSPAEHRQRHGAQKERTVLEAT